LRNGHSQFRSPFFAPEFIRTVANVRNDVHLYIGESSNGLDYYCPLHVNRNGTARGIGGVFSDRNGIVAAQNLDFNMLDLCQDNNIQQFISNGCISDNLPNVKTVVQELNNETHIKGDLDSYYEGQRAQYPAHFKRLRRLRRKLDKDYSDVQFRFDDRRKSTYDALMAMKSEQYCRSGRHDVLGPKWVKNMFSELRTLSEESLRLRLSSLFVDGRLIAAELNMQSNQTLHGWIVAFDPEYGKYSPGNLLTHYILENMIENGLEYYDSGVGGDHYKKYITNVQLPLAVGKIYAHQSSLNPKRILGSMWGFAENKAPEGLANLLQRSRRRSEQILATEIDNLSRVKGYLGALNVEGRDA